MLGDIDFNKKPIQPDIYLCKPNKIIIKKIKEGFFNNTSKIKLGGIYEFGFEVPSYIEINSEFKPNPLIDLLKSDYLLKVVTGVNKEIITWYVISKISEGSDDSKETKSIQTFSLEYELTNKSIINYNTNNTINLSIKEILVGRPFVIDGILSKETGWSLGEISSKFKDITRPFTVSGSKAVLESIFEVAKMFKAIVEFDTEKQKVHFRHEDEIGKNIGLTLNYKKYLRSINKDENSDEMVTRLKVFGKDGIDISSVNPNGTSYFEDYSFYMYPFKVDSNGVVIKSSDYMSDGLCLALLNYSKIVDANSGKFRENMNLLKTLQSVSIKKNEELAIINSALEVIKAKISIYNTDSINVNVLLIDKENKIKQQSNKQNEIDILSEEMAKITLDLTALQGIMSMKNNLTKTQQIELNRFTKESELSDERFTEDMISDLYEFAKIQFQEMKKPKITIKIDIVNFLELIESQLDWDMLHIGDIIRITHSNFNIDIQAKIIEIDFDYENRSISLTISNIIELISDDQKLANMLYASIHTSSSVASLDVNINDTKDRLDKLEAIIQANWKSSQRQITAGSNNNVVVNGDGISSYKNNDKNELIRIDNGSISISQRGEDYLVPIIDVKGINMDYVIGLQEALNDIKSILADVIRDSKNKTTDIVLKNDNGELLGGKLIDMTGISKNCTIKFDDVKDKWIIVQPIMSPITNLLAETRDRAITLRWTKSASITDIKIIGKIGSYPTSESDGNIVFWGLDTSCSDTGLINGTTYYYRFFTYTDGVVNNTEIGQEISATPNV